MSLKLQRRLASDILKAGESRIWIDPESLEEVSKAITRADIKGLIVRNVIQVKPKQGVSRGRAKMLHEQRLKGRRKGPGKRRGTAKARSPKKTAWMNKIRPQRRLLRLMRSKGTITNVEYRKLYNLAKGNFFRNYNHLKVYVEKMKEG
jgi:large subunit ribosomal protein L19e